MADVSIEPKTEQNAALSIGELVWIFIRRAAVPLTGLTFNVLSAWAFDYALYPFAIWQLGAVNGGLAMTVASIATCYGLLRFYDWTRQDWLCIEFIKQVRDGGPWSNLFVRTGQWVLRRSKPVVLVALSLRFDPLITVLYMREGYSQYNGLSRRDWGVFILSALISNAYWTGAVTIAIDVIRWLWLNVANT